MVAKVGECKRGKGSQRSSTTSRGRGAPGVRLGALGVHWRSSGPTWRSDVVGVGNLYDCPSSDNGSQFAEIARDVRHIMEVEPGEKVV